MTLRRLPQDASSHIFILLWHWSSPGPSFLLWIQITLLSSILYLAIGICASIFVLMVIAGCFLTIGYFTANFLKHLCLIDSEHLSLVTFFNTYIIYLLLSYKLYLLFSEELSNQKFSKFINREYPCIEQWNVCSYFFDMFCLFIFSMVNNEGDPLAC